MERCGIPDAEGVVCERPVHSHRMGIWPMCWEHGQEYRDYATLSEEQKYKPLEPAEWVRWKRTGRVKQGNMPW